MLSLHTKRLLLRDILPGDADALHVLEADPQVVRYMVQPPQSLEEVRAYVAKSIEAQQQVPRTTHEVAVVRLSDAGVLGRCGVQVSRTELAEGTVWYQLRRDCWGQGLMTEAVHALVTFAFRELRLRRIWADIDPRNVSSARLLEKLGFRREAHFVENALYKGEWCDTVIYGVLAREWNHGPRPA
jgi:[ribosomal protein S5]-alanine N-acetyltransferase